MEISNLARVLAEMAELMLYYSPTDQDHPLSEPGITKAVCHAKYAMEKYLAMPIHINSDACIDARHLLREKAKNK